MLKLGNIKVTINDFVILRGINLELAAGELVALVGRNGAGKTTTLKSIMGLVSIAGGSIDFDGQDLLAVPPHQRAALGIGYVPEDRRLIGSLTVQDNILMPAWANKLDTADERLDYIYGLMPELAPFVKRRASMLSGGQQKMVALARALMSGTKLLLLDEPFEGLSPGLGNKFGETIQQLQKDGLTVLLAESDDKTIDFAGKTYIIERGETVDGAAG
ncbi:MAG: ATP-binding cassette domain-containing protein [Rhodospirillaceae bacterium]|jgi:branched-chain amino acid transport system ATP-binding protein|nr:ATP-binding cassette domain-containing protein [Rhodospirillaceae bacterium]MBT5456911.1 ATP-binding cassette domain-containing protein [Rhodospirillaceae bacterium]